VTATPNREIEVKLEVLDCRAILALFDRHGGLEALGFTADGPVVDRCVLDEYLDTADARLQAAGHGARIRTELGRRRLTIKSAPRDRHGSVYDRLELESPVGPGLDPASWPRSPARALLEQIVAGAELAVIARIRQQRRTLIVTRGSTVIDLSLDELEALALDADDVLARTTELEAELLAGPAEDVERLATGLLRLPGLRAATRSKLAWAMAALLRPARAD
jgi:inorganic triphosphatase YgiF